MNLNSLINIFYIISSILFIFGLKMLSSPDTARRGNLISALGMLIAVLVTLISQEIITYEWIVIGLISGSLVGLLAARYVQMTQMPQMVALFNGFGGLASLLVGVTEYLTQPPDTWSRTVPIILTIVIGGTTLTGSLIAFAKLAEILTGKPIQFWGQQFINLLLCLTILILSLLLTSTYSGIKSQHLLYGLITASSILGITQVIRIGGADMPVVIALLNSYSGIAASSAGFVINNNVLIVAGSLVGASGIILTSIMCKSMNRSLSHVLFSGFGATQEKTSSQSVEGNVKPIRSNDAYLILEAAQSVVIIPGYGMAVAQAQHVVKELGDLLEQNGTEVKYAIHPVAGRMPGHMNVLLAEANVGYDLLKEPQDVNPMIDTVDVCLVIGANDVVNPAARDVKSSPIYGMPVIEADKAKTIFILKRSMASGFAGITNPLFFQENTRMLFGDAKASLSNLISQFKS